MTVLAAIIHYAFAIYQLGLVAYIVCSWIDHPTAASIRYQLARWYEPILTPIRSVLPAVRIGYTEVDLSPILLFIGLAVLRNLLLSLLLPPF